MMTGSRRLRIDVRRPRSLDCYCPQAKVPGGSHAITADQKLHCRYECWLVFLVTLIVIVDTNALGNNGDG